jgi:hypothetical protein
VSGAQWGEWFVKTFNPPTIFSIVVFCTAVNLMAGRQNPAIFAIFSNNYFYHI